MFALAIVGALVAGPGGMPTPTEARAHAALHKEFEKVRDTHEDKVRAEAKRVLRALQNGDIESLVAECTMYDATAPDRVALTRTFLTEHKEELRALALVAGDLDAPTLDLELQFRAPEPEAGMPGSVYVLFGPAVERPADAKRDAYPKRHALALTWSGPLMPEANGVVRATPPANAKPGRWRFNELIKPYARAPVMRL